MRIVLDTNVLISGILNPDGNPGKILGLLINEQIRLVTDSRVSDEYHRVLKRPRFRLTDSEVSVLTDFIDSVSDEVVTGPSTLTANDPDDQKFLEVAQTAQADYLVTGNLADFPVSEATGFSIVSPADFIRVWIEYQTKKSGD